MARLNAYSDASHLHSDSEDREENQSFSKLSFKDLDAGVQLSSTFSGSIT